jgi:hypothetical protein
MSVPALEELFWVNPDQRDEPKERIDDPMGLVERKEDVIQKEVGI